MEVKDGILISITSEEKELAINNPDKFTNLLEKNKVKSIGDCVFRGMGSLKLNKLPEGLTIIYNSAFQGCTSLALEKLPEGLTEIGVCAFDLCTSLALKELPENLTKICDWAFHDCTSLALEKLPEGLTKIDDWAFSGCTSLAMRKLPESLTKIGDSSFRWCTSLALEKLPDGITEIGRCAFDGCTSLKLKTLPDGLTCIENSTFRYCTSLALEKLPEGLTKIGDSAFYGCKSLALEELPESLTKICDWAFHDCTSLALESLSDSLVKIGEQAFMNCTLLALEKLPESLTEIGKSAFQGCTSLTNLTLPLGIKKIGSNAFADCDPSLVLHIEYAKGKYYDILAKDIPSDDICSVRAYLSLLDKKGIKLDSKTYIPQVSVISAIPESEIENFYKSRRMWFDTLGAFAKSVGKKPNEITNEAKADFFRLCLASGLFNPDEKTRNIAKTFLTTNIIGKFSEEEIHSRFGGLQTQRYGYRPKFALFMIKNWHENFLLKKEDKSMAYGEEGNDTTNLFSALYNRLDELEETHYNKLVVTDKDSQRLTEEDCFSALTASAEKLYGDAIEETELADLCAKYGYSKEDFITAQKWFKTGKEVKPNIFAEKDTSDKSGFTFELLDKSNPLGAVLGDITNCCQRVEGAGATCCEHGMTDPNGGFMVFSYKGKIVAQAWVWYNEKLGKLCYDNVEVPDASKPFLSTHSKEFFACFDKSVEAIKEGMAKHGKKLSVVTMGEGYNDVMGLFEEDKYKKVASTDRIKGVIAQGVIQASGGIERIKVAGQSPDGVYTDTDRGERYLG